jgi:hypothetical protein
MPSIVMRTGTKTVSVAGSRERLAETATYIHGIWVAADMGNTNPVIVGDENVAAASGFQQGVILIPGNPSIRLPFDDLSKVYVDAITNGDMLCYAVEAAV